MKTTTKQLGVIWSDTEEDPSRFEMAQATFLNRTFGCDMLAFEVEYSKSPPGHSVDALFEVGNAANIAAAGVSLAQKGVEAVVWACTSGSFIGGLQWCLEQQAELRAQTGLPATSGTLALISSCSRLGYRSVDVLSPYPEEVSEIFVTCLRDAGLGIGGSRMLNCESATASAGLCLTEECRAFANGVRLTGDAVMISDTAVNSLRLIPELEAALGKPVVTVNQACLYEGALLLERAHAFAGKEAFHRYQRTAGGASDDRF